MILVGQYDSPYVRRVAVTLRVLGHVYEHDTRSIFGDFDALRALNPTGRIPALVLDDGAVLAESGAIVDWLDADGALLPRGGLARRDALQRIALATAAIDKCGAANYEEVLRPAHLRWPEWAARCKSQAAGALDALDAHDWDGPLDQAQITAACAVKYIALSSNAAMLHHPRLAALSARCEALPAFAATDPGTYVLPQGALA